MKLTFERDMTRERILRSAMTNDIDRTAELVHAIYLHATGQPTGNPDLDAKPRTMAQRIQSIIFEIEHCVVETE